MYLKSLELNGFKSFGKKSALEFNSPITSIVGPNGSGKSNVAEAFRFVLGEQSIKSMRGKKGEDLIFNGSEDGGRCNRAGVKLVFDNSKKFLNVDFDEVSLERIVYRDGVNEYYINGSKVRLKDITELLASAHIGSSGHHIISQGEADRILHSNPKERRDMIEDALGIKIYQYKKEESERKLERTEENIKQVESLRREIAPHLKFLKKQVEKIEKAKEVRDELSAVSKEYFKREEDFIKEEKERVAKEKNSPTKELHELGEKLSECKRLLDKGSKEDGVSPEIIEIEHSLQSVRQKKDNLMRELGKIEGEISYVKRAYELEEKTLREEDKKQVSLKDVESVFEKIEAEAKNVENSDSVEVIKNAINLIKNFLSKFIKENKNASSSDVLGKIKSELETLQESKLKIEEDLKHEVTSEKEAIALYERKKKEIEKVKDAERDAEKEIFRIVARQNELHQILDKIKSAERDLVYLEESYRSDLAEIGNLAGLEAIRQFHDELKTEERSEQLNRRKHIERLKIRLEEMGVSSGDDILKEYKDTEERDAFLVKELSDLEISSKDLKVLIKELEERLNVEFKEGVTKINNEFGKYFTMMFDGGNAMLKLIKPERKIKNADEFGGEISGEVPEKEEQDGIDIEVSLPRKKIKGLMMLSGGERALTSIALLFAISQVNPPPFIILDETDAALDEANSRKYGDMVENLSKHSQLIVITHNRETMSRAGVLYGITMGKDSTSKLLSIAFEEAVEVAK